MMRPLARSAFVAASCALGAALLAPALPSCGEHFEPPCTVTEQRVVLPASASAGRVDALALSEGDNGDVVILWLASGDARLGDAGAREASAGDAGDGGTSTAIVKFIPPHASVAVVGADGSPRLLHTFPPPAALTARRGSTDSAGATFIGDGALFHWIETSTSTRPDGTTSTTASAKMQRVGLDGREGPLVSDPELTCTGCSITTAFASAGAVTLAMVRIESDGSTSVTTPSRTLLLALDATGARTATFDLAPLIGGGGAALPSPPLGATGLGGGGGGAPALKVYARGGRFVVAVGMNAAVFDERLAVVSGPWALPSASAEIDMESGAVDVAWAGTLSRADGGAQVNVGDMPDLLYESRSASGPPRIGSVRVSTTSRVRLVRRNGGRAGVLHTGAGQVLFTLVGDDGRKIGGDHRVASTKDDALAEFAASQGVDLASVSFDSSTRSQLLFPVDRTHFVAWTGSSDVLREVITCAP